MRVRERESERERERERVLHDGERESGCNMMEASTGQTDRRAHTDRPNTFCEGLTCLNLALASFSFIRP